MGIARGAARLILSSMQGKQWQGSLLQLGRQDIHFSFYELEKWARLHKVNLASLPNVSLSQKEDLRERGCIDDKTFFSALGCNCVESCDFSNYENPTHVLDLNIPVSSSFHENYDVIINGGTIEHIFHLPQVLENIGNMLKVGGKVIHLAPSSNHVEHGFYMFSPAFFFDYYTANHWKIETFKFFEYQRSHDVSPWRIYNYTPGCLDHFSMGGFDRGYLLGIFVVATKTEQSGWNIIPQQGRYTRVWDRGYVVKRSPRVYQIMRLLKKVPFLFHVAQSIHWHCVNWKQRPRIEVEY